MMRTKPHRFCANSRETAIASRPRRRTGQTCSICRHERRFEIELALVSGVSRRAVGRRYIVSPDACWRHLNRHVDQTRRAQLVAGPMSLAQLADKATAEGMTLVDYLSIVRSTLMSRFLAAAEFGDDPNTAMLGGRLTEVLRLAATVTGEISRASTVVTNNTLIMSSPLMADLQRMLAERLRPYPEALRAVLEGLEELEARAVPKAPALEALTHVRA